VALVVAVDVAQMGYGSALEGIGKKLGLEGVEEYGGEVVAKQKEELAAKAPYATRLKDVREAEGVLDTAGELASFTGSALGESLPQMGTTLGGSLAGAAAGARAGLVAGLPGAVVGGIAGGLLANIPFFYGTNREAQKAAVADGTKIEVDEGAAFLASIPQAVMDLIADRFLFGLGSKAGVNVEGLIRRGGLFTRGVKGAALGVTVEVPTEVGQQVIERFQAGRPIDSPEAMEEYLEVAAAAGLVGGSIRGATNIVGGDPVAKEAKRQEEAIEAAKVAETERLAAIEAERLAAIEAAEVAETERLAAIRKRGGEGEQLDLAEPGVPVGPAAQPFAEADAERSAAQQPETRSEELARHERILEQYDVEPFGLGVGTETTEPRVVDDRQITDFAGKPEDFSNPDFFYRVIVGDAAFEDISTSGVVRTNSKSKTSPLEGGKISLKNRPTLWPSFSKGKASMSYAAANPNHYIVVTADSSLQPSKSGRHGKGSTMFPTDQDGNEMESLDASKVDVYKHEGDGIYTLVHSGSESNTNATPAAPKTRLESVRKINAAPAASEAGKEYVDSTAGLAPELTAEKERLLDEIYDLENNTPDTVDEAVLAPIREAIQVREDAVRAVNRQITDFAGNPKNKQKINAARAASKARITELSVPLAEPRVVDPRQPDLFSLPIAPQVLPVAKPGKATEEVNRLEGLAEYQRNEAGTSLFEDPKYRSDANGKPLDVGKGGLTFAQVGQVRKNIDFGRQGFAYTDPNTQKVKNNLKLSDEDIRDKKLHVNLRGRVKIDLRDLKKTDIHIIDNAKKRAKKVGAAVGPAVGPVAAAKKKKPPPPPPPAKKNVNSSSNDDITDPTEINKDVSGSDEGGPLAGDMPPLDLTLFASGPAGQAAAAAGLTVADFKNLEPNSARGYIKAQVTRIIKLKKIPEGIRGKSDFEIDEYIDNVKNIDRLGQRQKVLTESGKRKTPEYVKNDAAIDSYTDRNTELERGEGLSIQEAEARTLRFKTTQSLQELVLRQTSVEALTAKWREFKTKDVLADLKVATDAKLAAYEAYKLALNTYLDYASDNMAALSNTGIHAIYSEDSSGKKVLEKEKIRSLLPDNQGGSTGPSPLAQFSIPFDVPTRLSTTVAKTEAIILERLGKAGVERISVTTTPEAAGLTDIESTASGVVIDGKPYLFTDNITEGDELGILLHELGVHIGMPALVGSGNYKFLINRIKQFAELNDDSREAQLAKRALERVKAAENVVPTNTDDELIAYFVEEAINRGINPTSEIIKSTKIGIWFRRFIAGVKNILNKIPGIKFKGDFNVQEIVDIAYGGANLAVRSPYIKHTNAERNVPYSLAIPPGTVGNALNSTFNAIQKASPEWSQGVIDSIITGLYNIPEYLKYIWYNLLSLRQMADTVDRLGPAFKDVANSIRKLNALVNKRRHAIDESRLEWQNDLIAARSHAEGYSKADVAEFFDIVHDSTIDEIDLRSTDPVVTNTPLAKRFAALVAKSTDIGKYDLRISYKIMADRYQKAGDALLAFYEKTMGEPLSIAEKTRLGFAKGRITPYFPLMRDGAWWVDHKDTEDGELQTFTSSFDSKLKAQNAVEKLKAQGLSIEKRRGSEVYMRTRNDELADSGGGLAFMGKMQTALEVAIPEGEGKKEAIARLKELILNAYPTNSLKQQFKKRRNVRGIQGRCVPELR
jgi:hypothetical protein